MAFLALASGSACAQSPSAMAAATTPGCGEAGAPQTTLPRETLAVQTHRGAVRFDVQVAANDDTRAKGLMFVRHMDDAEGMIFVFPKTEPVAFWMRNTFIPLDLLFVDAKGKVLNVAANAAPCDERPIPSAGPARAVIEINGGLAARLGIRSGDHVTGQRIFAAR